MECGGLFFLAGLRFLAVFDFFLFFFSSSLVVTFCRFVGCLGRRLLFLDLRLVAQYLERRRLVFAQGDNVNPGSFRISEFKVDAADDLVVVAVGEKIEILPFRIEDPAVAVGHAGGHRRAGSRLERIQVYQGETTVLGLVVDQPQAVGRPGVVGNFAVFPAVDFDRLPIVDVYIPQT